MAEIVQCLMPDGRLTELGEKVWNSLDQEEQRNFYYWMGLMRTFDRKSVLLQRQGRMGTYAPFEGQEASQVGAALALSSKDWLFPSYRDHAATMVFGMPMKQVLHYWMGRIEGNVAPDGLRIMPPCVPIATQIPQAMGAAWSSKCKQEDFIAVAFFGDGATSEGDFHEACNFAGIFQLPLILFCQNNGYAISVPMTRQSASPTIAEKAAPYHFPGIRVDGNDVLAVYHVMSQAVKRARNGEGSTLIEAITYRTGSHTTADDASRYRPADEVNKWREKMDPLLRYQTLLEEYSLLLDSEMEEMEGIWKKTVEDAVQEAEAAEPMPPTHLFEHVFEELPDSLVEQRRHFAEKELSI